MLRCARNEASIKELEEESCDASHNETFFGNKRYSRDPYGTSPRTCITAFWKDDEDDFEEDDDDVE